jgi:hypothetical protein
MSDVVTCACGKRLRLREGSTAKAIRCPGCQAVVRLDGAAAPAPAAAGAGAVRTSPAPADRTPSPKSSLPKAASTAPAPAAEKPAAVKPRAGMPARKLIEDPPDVWLYVDDPEIIARVEAEGDGRQTSLRTWGPDDDPLADLGVKDAKAIRSYLSSHEYIAWASYPSKKKAKSSRAWVAWFLGFFAILMGAVVVAIGFSIDLPPNMPTAPVRIGVSIVGGFFAAVGLLVIVLLLCGAKVVSGADAVQRRGLYLITNRRCIVWGNKNSVRSFCGPVVMGMSRVTTDDEEDVGSLMFSHGLHGGYSGFVHVDKVSEVEELVRGYLVDPVLEKAGQGTNLPASSNQFKKGAKGEKEKKGPKQIELWQACVMEMEAEHELTPEMIKAAKEQSKRKLQEFGLDDADAKVVRGELKPGEVIVWMSRANAAAFFRRAWWMTLGALIFVVLAGAMVAGALAMAGEHADRETWLMVGGIFGGIGAVSLLVTSIRPFWLRSLAQKRLYVLTNRRALVWAPKWSGEVRLVWYGPRELSNIYVRGDNVVFHSKTTVYVDNKGHGTPSTQMFGFLEIEDAPKIERTIREMLLDPFLNKAYE